MTQQPNTPIQPEEHRPQEANPLPIRWGASSPAERGPIIATLSNPRHRNVLGAHAGAYAHYRALAVAVGALDPQWKPDLSDTQPTASIGPYPQWYESGKIVSLDPFGASVTDSFGHLITDGYDIRPTIAITKAHIEMGEIRDAINNGQLKADGKILLENGTCPVTEIGIEPVWHLPGIARRFGIDEKHLRRALFEHTAGMFPDLVTRNDLEVFLPPIGGTTIMCFGDPARLADEKTIVACRVHDACIGSDVFSSDVCTCRPYLAHGVEVCIETAQRGGVGIIVYNHLEGRALGQVTKFLVYNARKRHEHGDTADRYFLQTEKVAGVRDARFQALMPDALHWLGIRRIHKLVSMSSDKYNAIVGSGIHVVERIPIPPERVPADAKVEMAAKAAAGYYGHSKVVSLEQVRGRDLK